MEEKHLKDCEAVGLHDRKTTGLLTTGLITSSAKDQLSKRPLFYKSSCLKDQLSCVQKANDQLSEDQLSLCQSFKLLTCPSSVLKIFWKHGLVL